MGIAHQFDVVARAGGQCPPYFSNPTFELAKPDDPELSPKADLVFVCDVLHHVQNRPAWLKKLHSQMPTGAVLVLIEFKSGNLPEGPPEHVKIPKAELIDLLQGAGFTFKESKAKLLPYQEFLVFVNR